jgi:DNA-binding NarL/FixJ family response regulator
VIEASSAEEALALVPVEAPRLVVMDISLPGMSGIEATRQIKAVLPSTKVVMLTIYEGDSYRADATMAGASAYVPKRAMQTELMPTLAALLANSDKWWSGSRGEAAYNWVVERVIPLVHTARSYIKSIHSEIDPHSRREAIEKGKELGLI